MTRHTDQQVWPSRQVSPPADWLELMADYEHLVQDDSFDSQYLRDVGLQRNVIDLVGDCSSARLLDVGCGNGWLLDAVHPLAGHECDCVAPPVPRPERDFSRQDIRGMTFPDCSFDIAVASLVLMWVLELDVACRELYRVTRPGGRIIIALVHPYSYRMGSVTPDGNFLVTRQYGTPFEMEDLFIAGKVGPFRYYHRPLHVYVNSLLSAGLTLTQMNEWAVDMKDYRRTDASLLPRTDRLPMFVFFVLTKVPLGLSPFKKAVDNS